MFASLDRLQLFSSYFPFTTIGNVGLKNYYCKFLNIQLKTEVVGCVFQNSVAMKNDSPMNAVYASDEKCHIFPTTPPCLIPIPQFLLFAVF